MKGQNTWSFAPYRPFLFEVGDIYICRVVPKKDSIHFEWLDIGEESYDVFFRVRGSGEFILCGNTKKCEFDITWLSPETEYEFFVSAGEKKSRVRLARCGESVGNVVNYLHPEDGAYSYSGKYLCSPSLLVHPDGYMLASMDVYEGKAPQNLTLIFRSDDGGENWHYVSELNPCFWGKMFLHKGEIYMLACSTEYGDLLIAKSCDGAKTFSAPVVLLRGLNGKNGSVGVHKNPQNIVRYNGRIYETLEWGSWGNKEYCHAAMVMSCDENDDLLQPENWHFTEPLKYSPDWEGVSVYPDGKDATIEGTLCVAPDGELYNIMRYQSKEKKVLAYHVNKNDHDAPLEYSHAISFAGNQSKFMIKFDEVTKKYYSIICRRIDEPATRRNLLSLVSSSDLENWDVVCDLIDRRNEDKEKIGFQYVDFEFDGADIIYLCRTAINGAHTFHDSNYSTFHRVKDFRKNGI